MTQVEALLRASRTEAASGRLDEALRLAAEASALAPAHGAALAEHGALLASAGRFSDAEGRLLEALRRDGTRPEVWNNLGAVHRALGRRAEAAEAFGRALALDPGYRDALTNFQALMDAEDAHALGVAVLEGLIESGTESAGLLFLYGTALWGCARADAALVPLRRAVALDPTSAGARRMLGTVLIELGDLAAARGELTRAIALAPDEGESYRLLAALDPEAMDDDGIARLRTLASMSSGDHRIEAHFALAHVLRHRGEAREAFAHLVTANRERRARMPYDERVALDAFENIARTFTREMLAADSLAHPTRRPIFIFGMPRSGTTLVEQIVGSHPHVHPGGELTLLDDIVTSELARTGALSRAIAERYDDALTVLAASGTSRVTDKLPANFRYAGLIRMAMPNAVMIHVRRDPLDTCVSCFTQTFGDPEMAWSFDLGETGRYYRGYARLMEHWRSVLPPNAMLEVDYEELVDDFEASVRRILEHCGLDWDDRCLAFHETERAIRTASAVQVRQPLYRSSVRNSRAYGDLLDPLREALGEYAPP